MNYGIVFTGQGSQYPMMAKKLIENYHTANSIFKKADELLGFSITDICTKTELFNQMNSTSIAQPAIFVTEYAVYETLKEKLNGRKNMPEFLAGHSLGEYSAIAAGRALSFEDTLRLVNKRGFYMSEAAKENKSCMIAVLCSDEKKRQLLEEYVKNSDGVYFSCENSQIQLVYAVAEEKKDSFLTFIESIGVKGKPLAVEGGFHSKYMAQAAEKLKPDLEGCGFKESESIIYSNTSGKAYQSPKEMAQMLTMHLTNCVQWKSIVRNIKNERPAFVVEIGPMAVLSKELKKEMPYTDIIHISPECDIYAMSEKIELKIEEEYKNKIKQIVRSLVCSKSDGSKITLEKRERVYQYLVEMIENGNIDANGLAVAKEKYQMITA